MAQSIYEFVRQARDDYYSQRIEVVPGYEFSQYETLRTIELYDNSQFLSGNKDSLGREKGFFNITKFRRNVATRATDLDTKDVHPESTRATQKGYIQSFVLSLKNRNWMKEANLATFLNRMGYTRPKYGHVVVKKVEREDELELHVVPWRDLITDQVDITNGVKIERHYYTPAMLKTIAPESWTNIDEAIATAKRSRNDQLAQKQSENTNRTPGKYIEVYEIHGVLPTSFLAGTSDKYPLDYGSEDEYERQMHVVVLDESKEGKDADGNIGGVTLYGGIEESDPYKDLAWEKVDGRGLGVGVVEDCFEAQVWTNDSIQKKKDALTFAGKILFQTTDGNIAARNVLTDLESGSIITTAPQTSITQVNNTPAALPGFDELIQQWNQQAENATSTYQAITGETMPSGTPFRLVATLNKEAGSMFVYRRQEAGLFLQEIYRDWVLPFLVKQLKKQKELTGSLEGEEQEMIATALAHAERFNFAKEKLLSGKVTDQFGNVTLPEDMQRVFETTRQRELSAGTRRSFKLPEDYFDDWEGTVDVITTGEQENKDAVMETLFNIFQIVAKFPQVLQDPVMARLFNQIVEKAGVSPLLLGTKGQSAAQTAPSPGPTTAQPMPTSIIPQSSAA
jgi:hypothetical protein